MSAWQPIETAPMDWSGVILHDSEYHPYVFAGYYSCEDGGSDCWMTAGGEACNPTEWQPLPEPPTYEEMAP